MTEDRPAPPSTPGLEEPAPSLPFPLQPGEYVMALYHRHWVHLWPVLPLFVVLALAPPLGLLWLTRTQTALSPTTLTLLSVVALAWGLFWLFRAYLAYYRYQNDIWVLTNRRLIDSYKAHWFHHTMASTDLQNIQNISITREGVLQTWLDFGDVACETAGTRQVFLLAGIPRPSQVLAEVHMAREAARAAS